MKAIRPLLIAASVLAAGSTLAATVPVLNFPAPGLPYSDTYGDFESYSMPILDWASTSSGGPSYMFNTANTIQDALVIGSGAQTDNQDLGLADPVQNGFNLALFAKSVVKHDFRWPRPATERVSVQQLIHGPSSETIPDNLRDSV